MGNVLREKIIMLLLAGVALGFSRTHYQYHRMYRKLEAEWEEFDRKKLQKEVKNLYRSELVKEQKNSDGSLTFVLSRKGKLKALTYQFNAMRIEEKKWDKKWRLVFFDIPEKYKWGRNALRKKLKELGFCEFQKSVFAFPHECEDEIDFVVEYYNIRKYVRYAIIEHIDNDLYLKNNFKMS